MPPEHINDLPDLPALESVEVKAYGLLKAAAVLFTIPLLFTALMTWMFVFYWQYLNNMLLIMIFGGGMAAVCCWMLYRILWADYYWKTDSEGLFTRGLLRKRYIKWSNVVSAKTTRDVVRQTCYKISIGTRTISIPIHIDGTFAETNALSASIWQHLRRYGNAENIKPKEEALTFWDRIPDELSDDLHWTNPKPVFWNASNIASLSFMLLMLIGSLVMILIEPADWWLGLFSISVFSGIVLLPIWEYFTTAKAVILGKDYLEVELPRRKIALAWNDLERVFWAVQMANNNTCLRIHCKNSTKVLIPLLHDDCYSQRLMLAIIRRLRNLEKPPVLIIPPVLRNQQYDLPQTDLTLPNQIVLIPSKPESLTLASLMAFSAGFGLFAATRSGDLHLSIFAVMLYTAGIFAIIWLPFVGYSVTADDAGITKRWFSWRKSVKWNDVKGGMFMISTLNRSKIFLQDSEGKTIMDAAAGIGTKKDRQLFNAFVQTKLRQILDANKIDTPWKARPWSPE